MKAAGKDWDKMAEKKKNNRKSEINGSLERRNWIDWRKSRQLQKREKEVERKRVRRKLFFYQPFVDSLKTKHILDHKNNSFFASCYCFNNVLEDNNDFSRQNFYYITVTFSNGYLNVSKGNRLDWNSNSCKRLTPGITNDNITFLLLFMAYRSPYIRPDYNCCEIFSDRLQTKSCITIFNCILSGLVQLAVENLPKWSHFW